MTIVPKGSMLRFAVAPSEGGQWVAGVKVDGYRTLTVAGPFNTREEALIAVAGIKTSVKAQLRAQGVGYQEIEVV